MSEGQRERKRRKWDVAAAVPVSSATGSSSQSAVATVASPASVNQTATSISINPSVPAAQPTASSSAPAADVIARAKMGAMSVLEKINKDLRAKGSVPMRAFGLKVDEERIRSDVSINDAPGPIRYNLTRRATQDDIARRTGTQIVVRGQYQPPGVPITTPEPPLFLKITPGAITGEADAIQQYAVDVAVGEVRHIINGGSIGTYRHNAPMPGSDSHAIPPQQQTNFYPQAPGHMNQGSPGLPSRPPGMAQGYNGMPYPVPMQPAKPSYSNVPPPAQIYSQQADALPSSSQQVGSNPSAVPLFVGFTSTPNFDAVGKLQGPGGSFLKHIATKTGAQVELAGRGSGTAESDQPLHILVTSSSQDSRDAAVRLAKSLMETVQNEFNRTNPTAGPPAQPTPAPVVQQLPYGCSYMPTEHPQPHQRPPLASAPPQSYPPPGQPYGVQQPHAPAPMHAPYNAPQQPYSQAQNPTFPGPVPRLGFAPSHQPQQHAYPSPGPYHQQWPAAASRPPGSHAMANSYPPRPQFAPQGPVRPQGSHVLNHETYQGHPSSGPEQNCGGPQNSNAAHQSSELADQQKESGRRRFKEVKDTPPMAPSQPAPYAPAPLGNSAHKTMTPMGPPPPKFLGSMGPPPPRNPTLMGPPAARPRQHNPQGSGNAIDSNVSGSLAGLVDYE